MPLGASEIYLILRARNEAALALAGTSKQLNAIAAAQARVNDAVLLGDKYAATAARNDLNAAKAAKAATAAQIARGKSLVTIGATAAIAGGLVLNAFNKMTNEAIKYNQSVSLTKTQVDKARVSFKNLSDMGLRVAKTVPVAFDEIQKSLYDIFSSLDTNGPGAEKILTAIAKASVGGATDMATAGRAIIAVLNAYKLPAQQVTHVSDVLFQLVRKGVGTYTEFTAVIGRAIPSALKAGQSIEELSGMMAFLTRNGLSTAMAAASAARALDALSKPAAIRQLHNMGVEVKDSAGRFRPMVDIVADMREKLKHLTPVARAVKLNEIFKGAGGTIQAMRFFNLGINDSNGLLREMTRDMQHSQGAAKSAYDVMSKTPQGQIQLLNNRYRAMRIELGNNLIPAKLALVRALTFLLGAFNRLGPSAKKWITYILAGVAALSLMVGVVIALAGAYVILTAAADSADIALIPIGVVVGAIILLIGAVVVQTYLMIRYWKQIAAFANRIWDDVFKAVSHAVDNVIHAWNNVYAATQHAWENVEHAVSMAVNNTVKAISHAVDNIMHALSNLEHALGNLMHAWDNVWHAVMNVWRVVEPVIRGIALVFYAVFGTEIRLNILAFQKIWQVVWAFVSMIWRNVGKPIFNAIAATLKWIYRNILVPIANSMGLTWKQLWAFMLSTWKLAKKFIFDAIPAAARFVWNYLLGIWHRMNTDWDHTWNAFNITWRHTGKPIFDAVGIAASFLLHHVLQPIFRAIEKAWNSTWDNVKKGFTTRWNALTSAIHSAIGGVVGVINAFIGAIDVLLDHLPGHLHIDKIGWGSKPSTIGTGGAGAAAGGRRFRTGGVLPGWSPGVDNISLPSYMFSGGEGILIPEATRAIGGKRGIDRINAAFSNRRSADSRGMFFGGGIIGGIAHAFGNTIKWVESGLRKGVASLLRVGLNLAEAPVKAAINSMPQNIVKSVVRGGYNKIDESVRGMIDTLGGRARKTAAAAAAKAGGVGTQGSVGGAGAIANQNYAKSQLGRFGWGLEQMGALIQLWNGESGWNQFAKNASSGAYGIPQSLPANKMASSGADWLTNPATQINWGMNYIKSVYGSPVNAFAQWSARSPHWYGGGLAPTMFNKPTLIGVGERGSEMVSVTPMAKFASGGVTPTQRAAHARLLLTIGSVDMTAFIRSLSGTTAAIKGAETTLARAVIRAGGGSYLAHRLDMENKALLKLSDRRTIVANKLRSANAVLGNAQKGYRDEVANVAGTIKGAFDITNAGYSPEQILGNLNDTVSKSKTLAAQLKPLGKTLNSSLFQQLAEAGLSAAPQVAALSSATPAQIKSINAGYAQLGSIGTSIGNITANSLYGAGINAAKGLISGLRSQENALVRTMAHLADVMVRQIKHRLGIHSESTVGRYLGQMFGQGFGSGISNQYSYVQSQAAGMSASAVQGSINPPSVGVSNGGTTQQFFITTNEIDPRIHAAQLGWELDTRVSP